MSPPYGFIDDFYGEYRFLLPFNLRGHWYKEGLVFITDHSLAELQQETTRLGYNVKLYEETQMLLLSVPRRDRTVFFIINQLSHNRFAISNSWNNSGYYSILFPKHITTLRENLNMYEARAQVLKGFDYIADFYRRAGRESTIIDMENRSIVHFGRIFSPGLNATIRWEDIEITMRWTEDIYGNYWLYLTSL